MEDEEICTNAERPDLRPQPPTRVEFMPLGFAPVISAASPAAAADLKSRTRIRIVIADDETIFRESLQVLLQIRDEFEVIGGCSHAEDALQMVRNLKPDVLLLDYGVQRDGCLNALAQFRESGEVIKVILLCSAITQEETIRCLRSGARGIISKTEPANSLIECIHKVVLDEYWLGRDGLCDLVHALCDTESTRRPLKNKFRLTQREIEMVKAVLEGYSNPEIATKYSLSEQTIKHHLSHVFDKLGVYSRVELALFAVNHDLNSE
jgi:two-component system nitrate/nitrite response regulator NarL